MGDAPPPSGERGGFGRGFGGRGDRGRGDRGRGDRGRGRGRGRRDGDEEKWVPVTKLGRLVQQVRRILLG
jgi:small subunit ribosomal protein S2e